MALTNGTIRPFHPEQRFFVAVVNGDEKPRNDVEQDWLKFLSEYPELKDN